MPTTAIRVPMTTYTRLRDMAQQSNISIAQVIEQLIEERQRREMVKIMTKDFQRLRANPEAWKSYQEELSAWDVTLLDGLEDFPWED